MEFKKWIVVLVVILGLSSCSSDDAQEDDNSSGIEYADVKPTQTKYKAFYGQKLTKNASVASRSAETSPNGEMVKPVSVIFYPRTQTISFSNIFDNKTVEYKVTAITNNPGVSVVYNFKINESTFTCTVTEKTSLTPANVVTTFAGGFYKFDITDSTKKNIAKLVSTVTNTAQYAPENNYTIKYTYADTLLIQAVRNSFDTNLQPVVTITDYTYNGGKLVGRTSRRGDGTIVGNYSYEYENNLITKLNTIVDGKVIKTNTYQYDKQGRVIAANYGNSSGTISSILTYTFEKNKMTTVYTNPSGSYRDVEVSTYESDRKPFLISQDQILEPFIYMNITKSISTSMLGEVIDYGDTYFEYAPDGLLLKRTDTYQGDTLSVTVREYVEE